MTRCSRPVGGSSRRGAVRGDELADEYLAVRDRIRERGARGDHAPPDGDSRGGDAPPRAARPRPPWPSSRADQATAETDERLTLAQAIDAGLAGVLEDHPEVLVFGEDVGRKGGVYGVTRGLQARFGPSRVFDTLLDETTILGLALGAAISGFVPIPEIQYLAYLHNAERPAARRGGDAPVLLAGPVPQPDGRARSPGSATRRGSAATSTTTTRSAALRDIPGLVVGRRPRGDDAAAMLAHAASPRRRRTAASCVFLEPIALYHTRDLHEEGDELWLERADAEHVPVGAAYTHRGGDDLTIVTWANGLYLSLRVARRLRERGIGVTVVDLRWLAPLPMEEVLREASTTGRTLVVDETRRTGGVGEGIVAELLDAGYAGRLARVASKDSFVPLGDAARLVLLSEDEIEAAALALARRPSAVGDPVGVVSATDGARRGAPDHARPLGRPTEGARSTRRLPRGRARRTGSGSRP